MTDQIVVNAACCSNSRHLCDRCRAESERQLKTAKPDMLPIPVVNYGADEVQNARNWQPTDSVVLLERRELPDEMALNDAGLLPPDPMPVLNVVYGDAQQRQRAPASGQCQQ